MNKQTINIQGTRITYLESNIGSRNNIVFIHGNSFNKESFNTIVDQIKNFNCYAIDLPGHGGSASAPNENYSIPYYAKMITDFITTLNLENVTLAGHCLGGHIAVEATPNLHQRLQNVITWSMPVIPTISVMPEAFHPHKSMGIMFSKDFSNDLLESSISELAQSQEAMDDYKKSFAATDPMARVKLGESISKSEFQDEVEIIQSFRHIFKIAYSLNDPVVSRDYCQKVMKNDLPFIESIEINSSHFPHIDTPELFLDKVGLRN